MCVKPTHEREDRRESERREHGVQHASMQKRLHQIDREGRSTFSILSGTRP